MLTSYIKSLINKDGNHWRNDGKAANKNNIDGSGVTITYNFFDGRPSGFNEDNYKDFAAFSVTQRGQIREVLSHYEDVANIKFKEVGSAGMLQFGYAKTFADFNGDGEYTPAGGLGSFPNNLGTSSIVINSGTTDFSPGTWGYFVWLHELGHAAAGFVDVTMGRNSNGEFSDIYEELGTGIDGQTLSEWQDSKQYTVMSYNDHPDMPGVQPDMPGVQPRSLMLYDIAALQELYGANWNHNSGNDTYSWKQNETFIETIWDGGGFDTIDASQQSRNSIIDLRAGHFSSIGSLHNQSNAVNNLAIAYGVTIENAVGGSGHDTIIGNSSNNRLYGGFGNDLLNGGAGSDFMAGGWGNDVYIVDNSWDNVYEVGGQGVDTVHAYIDHGLSSNVENLTLQGTATRGTGNSWHNTINGNNYNNALDGGLGNDFLNGHGGNDHLIGGFGNDTLIGGVGNDSLTGGSGNDLLMGEWGADVLSGGYGADGFRFNGILDGIDRILDFSRFQGDKIQLSAAGFGGGLLAGFTLGAHQFAIGAASRASDRVIYNPISGALGFDVDGAGGFGAVQFAAVQPGTAMNNSDFVLV